MTRLIRSRRTRSDGRSTSWDPALSFYFEDRAGSEPDIVCIPDGKTTMRTRFYGSGKSMEHELLFDVDPRKSSAHVEMGGQRNGTSLKGLH